MKVSWLRRRKPIDSRSIMVFGVPKELQNEISLAGYFDSAFDGLGKVENVVIARKWSKIKKAVAQRAHYLLKFEVAYCLAGLIIMQLTMMGLLALKSNGSLGFHQVVLFIGPLPLITIIIFLWLKQRYERQISAIPLDLLYLAAKESDYISRAHNPLSISTFFDGGGELDIAAVENKSPSLESSTNTETNESAYLLKIEKYHKEPPMTRIPGILDTPVFEGDSDIQNLTYLHPCLIGRLPVPWLYHEPEVLERIRSDQKRIQVLSLRRYIGRQRLGLSEMEGTDSETSHKY